MEKTLLGWIENIVKASFVCVVFSICMIILSLVFGFIRLLISKERKITQTIATTFGCVFLSTIILIIPIGNVCFISQITQEQIGKENEDLYVTYPEYKKYASIFDVLNKLEFISNEEIGQVSNELISIYDKNSSNTLVKDLKTSKKLLEKLDKSGIVIIYSDSHFDFSKTQKGTFDFKEIEELIGLAHSSELYKDIPREFTNQIMRELEKIVVKEFGVQQDIDLEFSEQEFKEQYKQLIAMLNLVVEYDLVRLLSFDQNDLSASIDSVFGVVKEIGTLTEIVSSPLIKKIDDGNLVSRTKTTIKLCVRLYTAMNNWLEVYKDSSLYQTSGEFLQMKGVYE